MLRHEEVSHLRVALARIEADLAEAERYARTYGEGWEHVEELLELHLRYLEALERRSREPVAAGVR